MHTKHLTSATALAMFAAAACTAKVPLLKMDGSNKFALAQDFNKNLEAAIATTTLSLGRDVLFEKRGDELVLLFVNETVFSKAGGYIERFGIPTIVSPTFEQRADGMYETLVSLDIFVQALQAGTAKAKRIDTKQVVLAKLKQSAWIAKLISLGADSFTARTAYLAVASEDTKGLRKTG